MSFDYKNKIFHFIFSCDEFAPSIDYSCYEIIKIALDDLGIKSKNHIYGIDIREVGVRKIINSVVVLVMPPDVCLGFCEKHSDVLKKNNNIIINWCFEVLGEFKKTKDPEKIKSNIRLSAIGKMIGRRMIDFSWVYDRRSSDVLKEGRRFYLPVGIHLYLWSNEIAIKKDKKSVCFFGAETEFRKNFFDKVKNIDPGIKIYPFDNFISRKNEIKDFLVAVDYPPTSSFSNFIDLHRVVSLVMFRIVVFSYVDLSQIGFIDGVDYIKFDSENGFCKKLNKLSREKLYKISQNALKKIKENFIMSEMFNNVFLKMKNLKKEGAR